GVGRGARAAGLDVADETVRAVVLRDGRRIGAEGCVAAVPPAALVPLLPAALRDAAPFASIPELETSPIVSTHLWFDRPVLRREFVGLLGTTTQWAFNRSALLGETGDGQCVSAGISAGRGVVGGGDRGGVTRRVLDARRALTPGATPARLDHAVVVKEKQAPVSPTPDGERLRPPARTALRGFVLAGDWTATGLPPTIESAVESGERAAHILSETVLVDRLATC